MAKAVLGKSKIIGWDGPLRPRWRNNVTLELANLCRRYSPVGKHTHDRTTYKFFTPRTGGELKRAWNPRYIKLTGKDKSIIHIYEPTPYARIQELGGIVPAVTGSYMKWRKGRTWICFKRKGYAIRGKGFILQAVKEWLSQWKVDWADSAREPLVTGRK